MFSDTAKTLIMRRLLSVENGRLTLFKKINYTVYPARAMAHTLQTIGEKNGEDFLFDLGFEAGSDAADEMISVMQLNSKPFQLKLTSMEQILEIIGFGKMKPIKFEEFNPEGICHCINHPVIEHAKELFGLKSLVCHFYMGVYSAHAQKIFHIPNCRLKETQCICKGDDFCEWVTGMEIGILKKNQS